MDASHRTIVRPSPLVAIAFTGGALVFGLPAIALACTIAFVGKGSWSALAVFGLIGACHASSAVFYWRRYLSGRGRQKKREESVKFSKIRD
ncbi:MAG: hypothetical protein ACYSU6_06265 [Planctomycetota bacterium]|jgi:uncharacterized membrane protein